MALSSWLRSLSNRSKVLLKPVPLASMLGLLLLGVFIWEYATHPEWFDEYSQEETTASGDIDLSGLTPEEQAAIADIDNLSLLFNELGIESGGIPNVRANPEEQQNGLRQDGLSLAEPTNPNTASPSPFAAYLEEYQFSTTRPEQGQPGATFGNLNGADAGPGSLGEEANSQSQTGLTPYTSPLETALQNQNAAADMPSTTDARTSEESQSAEAAPTTRSNFEGQFSSEITTIPGVDTPVLPTLPQMSPPPGTTGYTPPATLEMMPPIPGRDRTSTLPLPGTSSLVPSSAGVPNLSDSSVTPNLAAPSVDVSNDYVTPYTPTAPAATVTPTVPPAPFSAPRPPGSYLGNGYINTFSNPTAPPN